MLCTYYCDIALGTLYAFQKSAALAKTRFGRDILAELTSGGISVGLYHTAGKGTRLAPLPGSENNNKPGVKLPTTIPIAGQQAPITILEAVIKQTGCYAKSRRGRLSVFWGDQVIFMLASLFFLLLHINFVCRGHGSTGVHSKRSGRLQSCLSRRYPLFTWSDDDGR